MDGSEARSVNRSGCTIGADLGTTNLKAIAFDARGHEIARAEHNVELIYNSGGAAEEDPRAVYQAATASVAEAARRAQALGYVVERVGLSAAMHSLIPVAADGTPLSNAITWMDTRASAQARELWDSPQGKAIYQRTGTPIHAMSPLLKLMWIRAQQPKIFQSAAKFVSLKEWVWHLWFGEWVVDASIASATGCYNLASGTWDGDALALAGLDEDQLSRIVPTTYVQQGVREQALLDAGITERTAFNVGASDGVLANLGVGAIARDLMVLTIGTSLAVRMGTDQPVTDPRFQPFCYVLDTGRFIVGGPSNSGGIVLDWLYHKVLAETQSEGADERFLALIAAAGQVETGDLLCLPYVTGERAPLWDADAKAVLFDLQLYHTRAHLMRAAVEGVILNAFWIASGLHEELGKPEQVLATGKVLQTDWIRQLTADVFDLPVQYRGAVDASVLGAAALANIATGLWTWDDAIRRDESVRAYTSHPGPRRAAYAKQFDRFRKLATALTTSPELSELYLTR
jgi:gluconokinase